MPSPVPPSVGATLGGTLALMAAFVLLPGPAADSAMGLVLLALMVLGGVVFADMLSPDTRVAPRPKAFNPLSFALDGVPGIRDGPYGAHHAHQELMAKQSREERRRRHARLQGQGPQPAAGASVF
jgi:hypothetical protein